MCGPHWESWSHGVLIQNVQSMELRVFWIPPESTAERNRFQTENGEERAFETYTEVAVAKELQASERCVEVGEFMGEDRITAVPCPDCQRMLCWQLIGIS